MNEEQTVLEVKNLDAGYGENIVLRTVSLKLYDGEALIIVGQNGSGKSTLLKTIAGMLPKKSGEISFRNRIVNQTAPHNLVNYGISFFVQGGLIMPTLTVIEHLHLAALLNNNAHKKDLLERTFEEFPILTGILKQRAGNLSGGERQMLSFGILLMQGTTTWLLDEPTAGLSPDMVQFTTEFLIRKNKNEGVGMLLVEHNMDVAFSIASHIVVVKNTSLSTKFDRMFLMQENFTKDYIYN